MVGSRKRWLGAAAMTLAVPTAWALMRLASSLRPDDVGAFHGARLGMTPADVRAHIDSSEGLRAGVADDGTYTLDLVSDDRAARPSNGVRAARFEFHLGLLVAIRADLDASHPLAGTSGLTVTESTVRHVTSSPDGGAQATWIARACPTHADEVRALLSTGGDAGAVSARSTF